MATKIFKTINIEGQDKKVLATSYSQIETYLSCPYKWKLDYLLGQRSVGKAEALDLGTSIHKTLEEYFLGIKDGKEISIAEAQEMLEYNMEVQDIPFVSKENKELAEEQHSSMIAGLASGNSKLAKFMKDKEVVACEKEFQFRVDLPFQVKYQDELYDAIYIIGSIDFIVRDKITDEDDEDKKKKANLYVLDFKSGKKLYEPKKLKTNLQLPIYSIIVHRIYGRLPVSTQYYFTRHDEFQEVMPLAVNEESCQHVYYKNGKIKQEQRHIAQIYEELINIFRKQYTIGKYKANPTALCSWCDHSPWYGNNTQCKNAELYKRKDIPIIKGRVKRVKNI